MPTYDYECRDCGGFEAFRLLASRNEPAECPRCGDRSPRVFSSGPRLALLDGATRDAMATNERARHEPRRSSDEPQRLRHPSGCGCCSTGASRSATVRAANGNKAFPTKRPWMISH
jgi:putative FmdB family regulatory protein